MERAEADAIYEQGREVVVAVLVRMDEQIERLSERVARQDERIAELERRLNRNSRNSSTPPSQDPPGAPERKRSDPGGRKQGAQPGHPGRGRGLLPVEAVDLVVEHWPARCGCGHVFCGTERDGVGEPARHQVSELPEIAVRVTEHRLHRRRCPDCGATRHAELPAGVPVGAFGPRLEAAVATLSVRNRVSRRDTVELIGELFGCPLAAGTVDAICRRAGAALEVAYGDLLDHVRSAPAVNIDETGWRLKGGRRTLWGAISEAAAVFRIAPDRHEREALALLGERFEGVVGSDRWWAYRGFDPARRQLCWSHLIRDFTAHAEGLAAQKEFGEQGLDIARRLFCAWEQFQRDRDRPRLKREVAPLKRELKALLRRGSKGQAPQARPRLLEEPAQALAGTLDLHRDRRRRADQQPSRARAARAGHPPQALARQPIRPRRAHHRALLSASVTCRLQQRSLFAYLAAALNARVRGDPVPLLV